MWQRQRRVGGGRCWQQGCNVCVQGLMGKAGGWSNHQHLGAVGAVLNRSHQHQQHQQHQQHVSTNSTSRESRSNPSHHSPWPGGC